MAIVVAIVPVKSRKGSYSVAVAVIMATLHGLFSSVTVMLGISNLSGSHPIYSIRVRQAVENVSCQFLRRVFFQI